MYATAYQRRANGPISKMIGSISVKGGMHCVMARPGVPCPFRRIASRGVATHIGG